MTRRIVVHSLRALAVVLATRMVCTGGTVSDRLGSAWEEYGFQNWKSALSIFEAVGRDAAATPDQVVQARIGAAFVRQYRMPGRDPRGAYRLYECLLAGERLDATRRALVLLQMGCCRAEQAKPDLDAARVCFRRAMAADNLQSVPSQEAVLHLIATYLVRPEEDAFREAIRSIDALAPRLEGTIFEAIVHEMGAQVALWLGDPEGAVAYLEKQVEAGIENRTFRELALFRIGRINEIRVKDRAAAASWYQRLYDEIPTSSRAYWAGQQARALRAEGSGNRGPDPGGTGERGAGE